MRKHECFSEKRRVRLNAVYFRLLLKELLPTSAVPCVRHVRQARAAVAKGNPTQ